MTLMQYQGRLHTASVCVSNDIQSRFSTPSLPNLGHIIQSLVSVVSVEHFQYLFFPFSDGNSEGLFNLSSTSGVLTLTRDLNKQAFPLYNSLTVTATDSGLPPLSTSVKVLEFLLYCLLTKFIHHTALF